MARPKTDTGETEAEKALRMIREATDGARDDAGLVEAVAVLISQRDNARKEAEEYSAEVLELREMVRDLS